MRSLVLIWLALTASFAMPASAQKYNAIATAINGESAAPSGATEYHLPPEKLAKSKALYLTRKTTYIVGTVYGVALLALMVALKMGPRLRRMVERVSRRRFVQALLFIPLLYVALDLLSVPIRMYGHHLSLLYGLSVQSWPSWWLDWWKAEFVNVAIATLVLYGLYELVRRSPLRWWLYAWVASVPVILLLVFAQPIVLDPLFNQFASLEQKQPELVTALEKVMQRGALTIDRSRMFEMQASKKLTTYNAYVTGIGASKRVVVWDNTTRDLTIPETLFIFAHEQGHYVLEHIWKSIALALAGLFFGMYGAYRLLTWVVHRYGARLGITALSDWASMPLALLVISLFSIVTQPFNAAFSRYQEHQADIYAVEALHGIVPDSSGVAATTFQKLGEKSLAYPDPDPWYVAWAFSHPPMRDRVAFAVGYRPWEQNEPTQFVK